MAACDPVPWEAYETALGPPAAEVVDYVDRLANDVADKSPYEAVKTVHDALATELDADERSVPGLGDPFVTAYLLESRGIVDAGDLGYDSLVERRPSEKRLRDLFWEREYTLWWIGVLTGVHASLVTYWCYELDVPLMERNLTAESLAAVRSKGDTPDE